MNARNVQLVAGAVLVIAGLYYLGRRAEAQQKAEASGTTATDKLGGLTTTPLNSSTVAIIARPFRAIESVVRKVASIPSSVIQGGSPDRLQPYQSAERAAAAYNAPLRPDYVPTVRALNNVVYLPPGAVR